jgi:hypothetical protein
VVLVRAFNNMSSIVIDLCTFHEVTVTDAGSVKGIEKDKSVLGPVKANESNSSSSCMPSSIRISRNAMKGKGKLESAFVLLLPLKS